MGRLGPARRSVGGAALPVGTTALLLLAWELSVRTGILPREISSPTAIGSWLAGQVGTKELWAAIGHTLQHTLAGLAAGSLVGVVLGLLMGELRILHRLFQGTLEFLRPIPVIVYLPLLILLFGAVAKTAILLVAVAVVWPMLFQTMYGIRAVDPLLTDTGTVFGLSRIQRLRVITMPSIAPYLATGIRVALSIALVVSVAIELIAGVPGLGWSLTQYQTAANYDGVYAMVVVTGTLSLVLNKIMVHVERSLLRWHVSNRQVQT